MYSNLYKEVNKNLESWYPRSSILPNKCASPHVHFSQNLSNFTFFLAYNNLRFPTARMGSYVNILFATLTYIYKRIA